MNDRSIVHSDIGILRNNIFLQFSGRKDITAVVRLEKSKSGLNFVCPAMSKETRKKSIVFVGPFPTPNPLDKSFCLCCMYCPKTYELGAPIQVGSKCSELYRRLCGLCFGGRFSRQIGRQRMNWLHGSQYRKYDDLASVDSTCYQVVGTCPNRVQVCSFGSLLKAQR